MARGNPIAEAGGESQMLSVFSDTTTVCQSGISTWPCRPGSAAEFRKWWEWGDSVTSAILTVTLSSYTINGNPCPFELWKNFNWRLNNAFKAWKLIARKLIEWNTDGTTSGCVRADGSVTATSGLLAQTCRLILWSFLSQTISHLWGTVLLFIGINLHLTLLYLQVFTCFLATAYSVAG